MNRLLSALVLMLSASFFAGCAVDGGSESDEDEVAQSDDSAGADEEVGSAESALTCPSPATCNILWSKCNNPEPAVDPNCSLLVKCFECGFDPI